MINITIVIDLKVAASTVHLKTCPCIIWFYLVKTLVVIMWKCEPCIRKESCITQQALDATNLMFIIKVLSRAKTSLWILVGSKMSLLGMKLIPCLGSVLTDNYLA